jgi:hypothetical protein
VRTKLARLRYAPLTGTTAALLVLLFWNWLETDMTRHMLFEFPLLLIAGAAVGRSLPEPFDARVAACNQLGLTGFVFALLALSFWMIPAALDAALLDGPVAVAKYSSMLLTGGLLSVSFRVAPLALQAFFVGNLAWMMATVGLIYQSVPQQLCVNYLTNSQDAAGEGLVAAAIIAACTWCGSAAPKLLDSAARDRTPRDRSLPDTR